MARQRQDERHKAVNLAWKWERYGRFIDAELLSELLLPGNRRASRRLARHYRDLGTLSPLVRELAPQHWVGDVWTEDALQAQPLSARSCGPPADVLQFHRAHIMRR